MKKLKWLSFLILPAIGVPIALSVSSCGTINGMMKTITMSDYQGTSYKNLKNKAPGLHDLLYGDKGFHKGNYLLFFSISINANVNGFLYGDPRPKIGNQLNETKLSNQSGLYQGINYYKNNVPNPVQDLGIVTITERDINKQWGADQNTGNKIPTKPCTPFDKYNSRDQEIDDDKKAGDYVRTDTAAKSWRSLISEIKTLFNQQNISESNDCFICIEWLKGYPLTSSIKTNVSDLTNMQDFASWLKANDDKAITWK